MSETERDRIAKALRLAQRLRAETVTLPGQPWGSHSAGPRRSSARSPTAAWNTSDG